MKNAGIISGSNIHLGYPRGKNFKEVISGLNISLKKGQMTCLLGRNGIGKSTLIKGLLGQLNPIKGEIQLKDRLLQEYSKEEMARNIAVVLTETNIPGNLTVEQLVALGRIPHTEWHGKLRAADYQAIDKAINALKISNLRKERLSELSDGQRQKAMIARAFAQEGEIMILDEPTAHLDLMGRTEIMTLLQQIAVSEQKAILVVTHNVELAIETAHEFWLLIDAGELIIGKPEDLILSGDIMRLLPEGDFKFDLGKGRLVLPMPASDLKIQGPEEFTFWVKQALLKAEIQHLPHPLLVTSGPFELSYQGGKFSSTEALIEFIQSAS